MIHSGTLGQYTTSTCYLFHVEDAWLQPISGDLFRVIGLIFAVQFRHCLHCWKKIEAKIRRATGYLRRRPGQRGNQEKKEKEVHTEYIRSILRREQNIPEYVELIDETDELPQDATIVSSLASFVTNNTINHT